MLLEPSLPVALPFNPARFLALAAQLRWGKPLHWVPTTASTNDDAMAAARAGAPEGALFGAEEQSAGRGRYGRRWYSPAGENLLFTLILRPQLEFEQLSAFTLAVGLAVRDALAPLVKSPVGIKWPNDVWIGTQKVCGILVQSLISGKRLEALAVGIGINVAVRDFPEDLQSTATSLALANSSVLEREVILAAVIAALEQRATTYVEYGIQALIAELRTHDVLRGHPITIDGQSGTASGLDETGRLIVHREDGQVWHVTAGTVER